LRLGRGALPAIVTATVIPISLFYSLSAVAGMRAGIIASLSWAYLVLGLQAVRKGRISGLLTITALTLTTRCVTWILHQTTFTYFFVPIGETVAMSALFVATLALGRPLLVSLARDFVPALGERLTDNAYRPLIRHLSWLWGLIYLGSASTSAALLTTQSIHWFLLMHQASGWIWTGSGVGLSLAYGRRNCGELMALAMGGVRPKVLAG
jgi:hypothetical protein